MNEIVKKDPNVKIHRNEYPTRLGHTILYDTLVDMQQVISLSDLSCRHVCVS